MIAKIRKKCIFLIIGGEIIYDLAILGGGPAAMTAAFYAAREKMNTLIVTNDIGGQMMLTTDIENWIGFQQICG